MYTISPYSLAEKCIRTGISIALYYTKSDNCGMVDHSIKPPTMLFFKAESSSDAKLIKIIFWRKIIKKLYFSNFPQKCIAQIEIFQFYCSYNSFWSSLQFVEVLLEKHILYSIDISSIMTSVALLTFGNSLLIYLIIIFLAFHYYLIIYHICIYHRSFSESLNSRAQPSFTCETYILYF